MRRDRAWGLLEPMPYRLTVDGRIYSRGTLQEIQAAVADLVTLKLTTNPVTFAADAGRLNRAFSDGIVQRALEWPGAEWHTTLGSQDAYPVELRITRE